MAIVTGKKKSGEATYQVKVRDPDGKWYPTPTFSCPIAAKQEHLRLEKLKMVGRKAVGCEGARITWTEFWEVWAVKNRTNVSRGWRLTQDQINRCHIEPVVGRKTMGRIDSRVVGDVMAEAEAKGLAPQTRLHIYNLMRRVFDDAVGYYEMLPSNPVKRQWHRPKVIEKARAFLLPEQSLKLLRASMDHWAGPAVWTQILAGLRPSEAQGLRWGAVDLESGSLIIREAYNRKVNELQNYPKQGDWGTAPIPPGLAAYLEPQVGLPEEFVCRGPKGGMFIYETYLLALRALCQKAGVPTVTPHELRHSSTEMYVRAGATTEDLRRLLNHSSLSATRRYLHRTDDRLRMIAGQVGPSEQGAAAKLFPISFQVGTEKAVLNRSDGMEAVS